MQSFRNNTAGAGRRPLKICCALIVGALVLLANCSAWKTAALDDYSQGKAALRSGEYEKAKNLFESALGGKNNLEESQAGLLQTLRVTGAYKEARERARGFLSARGNSAILNLEFGRILEETGDYAEAEKHLRQSLALAPAGSAMRLNAITELGDLLEQTGRRADAGILWDLVLDQYRARQVKGSDALGSAALAAWRRGYERDARDLFADATEPMAGEVSLDAFVNFGYLLLEKYNARDALGVFRDCLKINKSHPRALLGIALAKKYETDLEVEEYARAALKVNPNLGGALNALAELALHEEDYDEALNQIRVVLAVNPANLESLSLEAFCHYVQGDTAAFAKVEKRAIEINPACAQFYQILAENLVSRRKYQEAVDYSRKAIALDPEFWSAYVTLGLNLMRVGDLDGGRKSIQQAFDGDNHNVWAFNCLDLFDQIDTFARSRSEHFSFLMSKEDFPVLSSYAPELAEEVYEKLTRRYGFKPVGPLQVEIYPDHGGFEIRTLGVPGLAGALGVSFGKVVAIDSPRARETGSFNWGSTLWHEFAHVMTLQMTNHNIPRWYSEGLSVYEEHRARPGWGDNLTNAFIQAYKAGKLMKASELNAGFVRPSNPGQIMFAYFQAGLVCEMIDEKFGFEKIRQSLLLFAENKPAEEVFRQTLGLDAAQMDAEYAKYLDSRFKEIASHVNSPKDDAPLLGDAAGGPDKSALMRQVRETPDDFWANLRLGSLLRKEGANSEAEAHLKKAQQLFPQYVEAGNPYAILGEMYLELKREEEALAQFNAWSRGDGDARDPLLKASGIYRKRKEWDSAARMLNLYIFINPYDPDAQRQLGEAAMESGKWPVALAAYRTLVGLNADPADAHYDLARALLASGNKQEAKREILHSLEIAPTYRKAQELLLKLSGGMNED
jgi:cellulose synthase operon protein C